MPLAFLGDENLPGRFSRAIRRHNALAVRPLEYLIIGEPPDLPLGSSDAAILRWIEAHDTILLTLDERSMPGCLAQHLREGSHVPGIFMIHPTASVTEVVEFLVLVAYASDAAEWRDHIRYVP